MSKDDDCRRAGLSTRALFVYLRMPAIGPGADCMLSERQTRKADYQDATQLQPSVANVPATCMLIFKLTSVTNTAQRLKLEAQK